MRNLIVVLGDQLNRDSAAFDGFDADRDAVWMAEASEESTHVPSTKMRIAVFLSAMRHFREACEADGLTVYYRELTPDDRALVIDWLAQETGVGANDPLDTATLSALAPFGTSLTVAGATTETSPSCCNSRSNAASPGA